MCWTSFATARALIDRWIITGCVALKGTLLSRRFKVLYSLRSRKRVKVCSRWFLLERRLRVFYQERKHGSPLFL